MTCINRILICLAIIGITTVFAWSKNLDKVEKIGTEVHFVDNIAKFRSHNPNIKLIPLARSSPGYPVQTRRYTLGNRISSDRLVAQGSNSYKYPTLQDVSLQLKYPQYGGSGAILTFVEVLVDQGSDTGNAYIVSGGIGKRNITIIVEAQHTDYFSYKAAFFGY